MGIKRKMHQQRGFTLLEAMVAAIVLATGLLSVLSLFAYSLSNLQMSQEDLIARAKAKEGLESVFSARDSAQIDFSQINTRQMAAYSWMILLRFTILREQTGLPTPTMTATALTRRLMQSFFLARTASWEQRMIFASH